MKIVNNCIDCVYDFQMRESCRDKLVHAMPTDLIARMTSILVIKPYGDKFYVVKSRYERALFEKHPIPYFEGRLLIGSSTPHSL